MTSRQIAAVCVVLIEYAVLEPVLHVQFAQFLPAGIVEYLRVVIAEYRREVHSFMVEYLYHVTRRHIVVERSASVVDRPRHGKGVVAVQYHQVRLLLLQHRNDFIDGLAVFVTAPEASAQMDVSEHHYLELPVSRERVVSGLRVDLRHQPVRLIVLNRFEAVDVVPQVKRESDVHRQCGYDTENGNDDDPHRDLPP